MSVLAVIPARGGSKGFPGKNIHPFCGIPLIAHTLLYAQRCPCLTRTVVSTDSAEIAAVARQYGGEVLMRDPALARDDKPIWAVLKAVLAQEEKRYPGLGPYKYVVLLEVTSPLRRLGELEQALALLAERPDADGIIATAPCTFNPLWNGFKIGEKGFLEYLVPQGEKAYRRQMVVQTWHHSGDFYVWRANFVERNREGYQAGKFLSFPTPWQSACSFDTLEELKFFEALVAAKIVFVPVALAGGRPWPQELS